MPDLYINNAFKMTEQLIEVLKDNPYELFFDPRDDGISEFNLERYLSLFKEEEFLKITYFECDQRMAK